MAQPVFTHLMLYMSAQNDLSNKAQENLDAIKASTPLDGISTYIMMDRIKHPELNRPDARNTLQYAVPPNATAAQFDASLSVLPTDKAVTNPAVFDLILGKAFDHFSATSNDVPPKQRILIFWGHGGGMVMLDEMQDNAVQRARANIKDFADVLIEDETLDKNHAFDIVAFDSCYMCMIETMNELRNATSYALCSSTMVDQDGFPYEPIVRHLVDNGASLYPKTAAAQIANIYNKHYSQFFTDGNRFLFLCDLKKISSCVDALNDLGSTLSPLLTNNSAGDAVRDAISEALLGAAADSSYVYSLAFLKMLNITLKPRLTSAQLQTISKKSETLKAAIAAAFSGNLGESTDTPVSPLIWVPSNLNAFIASEQDYNALDSSQNGEGGWANMWRLYHRREKSILVAHNATTQVGLPLTRQLSV